MNVFISRSEGVTERETFKEIIKQENDPWLDEVSWGSLESVGKEKMAEEYLWTSARISRREANSFPRAKERGGTLVKIAMRWGQGRCSIWAWRKVLLRSLTQQTTGNEREGREAWCCGGNRNDDTVIKTASSQWTLHNDVELCEELYQWKIHQSRERGICVCVQMTHFPVQQKHNIAKQLYFNKNK